MEAPLVRIIIDGKQYEVKAGKNLLETCVALGFDLPYFCYHPAMGSVGSCRLCAVKRFRGENDTKGRIIMSCMEPVTDGMIISVDDPEAKAFRASVTEGLMTNHPHDCPVCDEGGECHLQDMTVMTGHNYRRYDFKKRTHQNQYLGPFIHHEMNRCIQCYRCVRFYRDYAGGKDLNVFSSRNHVYFGRHEEGVLENEFSGNLVEVCPTGVFTDKTLKQHYTRKWDLTNAPSICAHCSVGCNTIASERYGGLRRIMNRYNGEVNGYFLCDRGRFGYEFVNGENRVMQAIVKGTRNPEPGTRNQEPGTRNPEPGTISLTRLASSLSNNKKIIGIGSPRASLEANFALQNLVGTDNFYHGIDEKEFSLVKTALEIMKQAPAHLSSIKEIEKADAVLILGEDVTNTAPRIALAVRQAIKNKGIAQAVRAGIPEWNANAQLDWAQDLKNPVFIATSYTTKLEEIAEQCFHGSPEEIADFGFRISENLEPGTRNPEPGTLEPWNEIAGVLLSAENPLIITGTHNGSENILKAASNILNALASRGKKAGLSMIVPESNSLGLAMMEGKSLDEAVKKVGNEEVDTVIILENDLYRRIKKDKADEIFDKTKQVIVLDHILTETAKKADILLPVGTFAESEGTLVSQEGRAQRFYRVFPNKEEMPESWRRLGEMKVLTGQDAESPWKVFDDVVLALAESNPAFSKLKTSVPHGDIGMYNEKIRRQTIRFSGRTAMNANKAVSEPKPPADPDSPMAFSMEGRNEEPPSSMVPFYWKPGWNSVQAANYYMDEPGGQLRGSDPGILLIEKDENQKISFFGEKTIETKLNKGEWLFVPVYRIFGSEELSSLAPAIIERIAEPFILLNYKDIIELKLSENQKIKIEISGKEIEVNVKADPNVKQGTAGVFTALTGMPFMALPVAGGMKNEK
jgi:NADH-quinone oxidoreductase subunit G